MLPLGPLGHEWLGPHDVAWHPAGYILLAMGELEGQALRFKVQAFAPGGYAPLWTYKPEDDDGLQMALTLALGAFGEIYAAGFGASQYPAVALISS